MLEKTCPASILEWKSHRLQRAVRSTLAAEAAALDAANDHAGFLGCLMSELFWADYRATEARESRIKVTPVTDCKSLYDAVHRLATNFQDKRTQIDVTALRQSARFLRWVPTHLQLADVFTKRDAKLRNAFRQFMLDPRICLIETSGPERESG